MFVLFTIILNVATAFTTIPPTKHQTRLFVDPNQDPFAAYYKANPAAVPQPVAPTTESQIISPSPISEPLASGAVDDAIFTLDASQSALVNTISATISDLESKPDFSWTDSNGIKIQGCSTRLDAYDAPGPSNIAWLSSLYVESKVSSLVIYNGPLTDVPHLVSKCITVDDGKSLIFTLDFRPRSYGAYEMRRTDGSYPGPDELGRKSFEYSGARNEFDSKFGTQEVKEFLESTLSSLESAEPCDPNPSELDLLTRGPLYLKLKLPNTSANVHTIVAARESVVNFWLLWAQDPQNEHRPGAPVNTQYVYDTKYKQNAYGALLAEYTELFGDAEGQQLTIGEAGPLDEAYVGGGS